MARLALAWERVWPALWPATFVVGAFVVVALFDIPAYLPDGAAMALLGLFVAALIAALAGAIRELRPPSHDDARRRLETASALRHRPLAALEDTLASTDDPATVALWREHQSRMAAAARSLRIGVPRAGLVRRDPYALRVALSLLLLLGAIDAGGEAPARIGRALTPEISIAGIGGPPMTLDIWVSPPQYTGLPPQFLSTSGSGGIIAVPIGSTVLARVHGGDGRPALVLDGHATKMSKIDDSDYKGEIAIKAGSRLTVERGWWTTLGSWPIQVVPDRPPTIAFVKPPQRTAQGAVHLEYEAKDDYGVEKVTATIRRPGDPSGQAVTFDLPLPDQHLKDAHGASFTDLTANPWAGLPVQIQLQAADALGQTGKSEILEFVLPERIFHQPVARAIIDERKELTKHPDDREPVADALEDLSSRPGLYDDDIVAFLGMRTAADRLLVDRDADTIATVQQLMWETAVRIEDGGGKLNREAMRESMQALQNALARNAPQSEIDRLMQQLQQQIQQYLQALAQRTLQQNPQAAQPANPSQSLTSNDLQRLLDRARSLAQTGDRAQARNLLAQLQDLLENLSSARPMQMQGATNALDAMHQLMRRQEQLLDQSFRQSQMSNSAHGNAAAQDALRQDLGDFMRKLGQSGATVPAPLTNADRAMGAAADALRRGSAGQAVGPQSEAVDALQQAEQALARQMQGQQMGTGNRGQDDMQSMRRDPFGRLMPTDDGNGTVDDGGVMRMGKAQNDYAVEKAKQILDELRRRAGEADRPAIEHDYIDRLLEEF